MCNLLTKKKCEPEILFVKKTPCFLNTLELPKANVVSLLSLQMWYLFTKQYMKRKHKLNGKPQSGELASHVFFQMFYYPHKGLIQYVSKTLKSWISGVVFQEFSMHVRIYYSICVC